MVKKVTLYPGDFYFGIEGEQVHTLLGSCISMVLWHSILKIGGMCHFVLPRHPGKDEMDLNYLDGRYADDAMELFRRAVTARGTKLNEYEGKIFGGSNVLGNDLVRTTKEEDLVGTRNAERALMMLMTEGVNVTVVHVGESGHRRIIFDIATGDVWVKHEATNGAKIIGTSGIN